VTAPAYDTLTVDDTGADKILTTGTMQAVDQNPVSIAQRGTNAPLVQPPVREYKTSGTGATWTIPTGVTAFRMYVTGGGGGGADNGAGASTAGGNSTATYNSVTYTGGGGSGGALAAGGGAGGIGGTATNGDENNNGQTGCSGVGPQPVSPGV
jgi:phage tail tape-measure protein